MKKDRTKNVLTTNETAIAIARITTTSRMKPRIDDPRLRCGAEIVTVAMRRVNLSDPKAPMLQDYVDPKKFTYLPNTAGCFTANEAVRTLRLAREAGGWNLVKLEVLGPPPLLYPPPPAEEYGAGPEE